MNEKKKLCKKQKETMSTNNNSDLNYTTLIGFCDMLQQFLEACCEVWPEDKAIIEYKLKLNLALNVSVTMKKRAMESIINQYHDCLTPYYQRCAKRDPTVFTEGYLQSQNEILTALNLREKWLDNSIDDETRDIIWEYVLEMNRYAQLYSGLFARIPKNTLGKIQSTAVGLANQIQSGKMKLSDLDLNKLGKDVVDGLDPAEIEEFTSNIMEDPTMLQNLCQSMLSGSGIDINSFAGGGNPQTAAALAALQMMQNS
jgi:hypothetical protein